MAAAKIKSRDNISENVYSRVFGVADYEYFISLKIENGGFKMVATGMKNRDNIGENVNSRDLRCYWLRI